MMSQLKRTSIYPAYKNYGAKLTNFGGWELPIQFSSIKEEHEAVRNSAGIFDVSHMGEILIEGKDAEDFLNYLLTNDISKVNVNQAQYSAMCYSNGGTVDDLLVYKLATDTFMLVVNAANTEKDFEWITQHLQGDVTVRNISTEVALIAIQGPKTEMILQTLTSVQLDKIGFFRFEQGISVAEVDDILLSRTGYTGEDGFELYLPADQAEKLWNNLLEEGTSAGLKPCGLGARDTLRFEACLALYGQELTEDITPLEAGLGFAVKANKDTGFIGKKVLKQQKEQGIKRKLVGIEITGRGIARSGYKVLATDDTEIGLVTSGTQSPTLNKSLSLALVSTAYADIGTKVKVQIRKKVVEGVIVRTPFYKKK